MFISRLYKDREKSPVEKAVWWVEYVARNGMEAGKLLKPITSEVPWYTFHHLDLLLILAIIIGLTVTIAVSFCRCCVRRCCYSSHKDKKE